MEVPYYAPKQLSFTAENPTNPKVSQMSQGIFLPSKRAPRKFRGGKGKKPRKADELSPQGKRRQQASPWRQTFQRPRRRRRILKLRHAAELHSKESALRGDPLLYDKRSYYVQCASSVTDNRELSIGAFALLIYREGGRRRRPGKEGPLI